MAEYISSSPKNLIVWFMFSWFAINFAYSRSSAGEFSKATVNPSSSGLYLDATNATMLVSNPPEKSKPSVRFFLTTLSVSLRICEQISSIESKFGFPQNVAYRTIVQI